MDELQRHHVEMTVTLLGGGDNIIRDLASIQFLNNARRVVKASIYSSTGHYFALSRIQAFCPMIVLPGTLVLKFHAFYIWQARVVC